jgi:hypothetical protein
MWNRQRESDAAQDRQSEEGADSSLSGPHTRLEAEIDPGFA